AADGAATSQKGPRPPVSSKTSPSRQRLRVCRQVREPASVPGETLSRSSAERRWNALRTAKGQTFGSYSPSCSRALLHQRATRGLACRGVVPYRVHRVAESSRYPILAFPELQ